MLITIHFAIAICGCACGVGILINRIWSFILALLALLSTFVVYVWWYFEKFSFMRSFDCSFDNPECKTIIQANFIQGIELFRGETLWDIYSLIILVVLFLYVLIKIWKESVKIRTANLR
jgi:hypothetical protein